MSAGILSQISFAKETTWGTAVVPTKSLTVRPTGGIEAKEDIQLIPGIRSQLAKNYDAIKGKVGYNGSFTFDCFADYAGYFFLSAFGTDTPALHSGETIVYDHVFSEAGVKPSLTIEQAITEDVRRFAGSICNQLKLSVKPGEKVELEASVNAKTEATASQIAGAFTTIPSFDHSQVVVKIGGTSISEVESLEWTYKNNQEFVYALGNVEPSFNTANPSEVNVKFDLYLDSTTLVRLTNYLANTHESVEIIITNPATIGSAAHYAIDILIPVVSWTTGATKVTDKSNVLSIEGAGIYDTATSQLVKATLTNLVTAY